MKRIRIIITGKVQGVFFRESVRKLAEELGVAGYVRNEDDGSVTIEAEGGKIALIQLVEWCKDGPREAIVEEVEVKEMEQKHHIGFKIV